MDPFEAIGAVRDALSTMGREPTPKGEKRWLPVTVLYGAEVTHHHFGSKAFDFGQAGVSHEVMRYRENGRG
jgi:hypothetical protein